MNKTEIGQLLTIAALVDNRTVTAEACLMWHEIVGDVDYDTALQAVKDHYNRTTDWLMPAHVRQYALGLRRLELPQTMSEAIGDCGAHRWMPDGTCMVCTARKDA